MSSREQAARRRVLFVWLPLLVLVILWNLYGCTTVRRECPDTVTTLREQHSQVVIWCQR